MKKLKLRAIELGAKEILSREQLKMILGGDDGSAGTSCTADSDCQGGMKCCMTTDGSSIKICTLPAGNGGCPTHGVSGCSTKCTVSGVQVGCYYDTSLSSCRCLDYNTTCS